MRMFDIKCETEQQADGSFTLLISATGLDLAQAKAISERMADPFRSICMHVITDGGRLPASRRNMKDRVQ